MLLNIHHYFSCVINLLPKYNIIFPGGQTRTHIGLYILIYLLYREAWLERDRGVTYPIPLYHLFSLPFDTYTYILISLYLDIRIPYPICLPVCHT